MGTKVNFHQSRVRKVLVTLFNKIISPHFTAAICGSMANTIGRKRASYVYGYDIIRSSSLELIAREIYDNKAVGNVAELGVYRGEFAKLINQAFPERKLYLFDTFEGFDKRDVEVERTSGFSKKQHDFSNTNIDLVLKAMPHRENCVVKKGFFPETAKDVEDVFVFVSIDVDLYEPIYQGLCYFYPRLAKGGYIFIHDYTPAVYPGTKEAVRRYCYENGISLFPLSDICGSAIITK